MEVFWITFRIEKDVTYTDRYSALIEAVKQHRHDEWWFEPTSFWLLGSQSSNTDIASSVESAINTSTDLVLIGSMENQGAILVGNASKFDTLKKLVPSLAHW